MSTNDAYDEGYDACWMASMSATTRMTRTRRNAARGKRAGGLQGRTITMKARGELCR